MPILIERVKSVLKAYYMEEIRPEKMTSREGKKKFRLIVDPGSYQIRKGLSYFHDGLSCFNDTRIEDLLYLIVHKSR